MVNAEKKKKKISIVIWTYSLCDTRNPTAFSRNHCMMEGDTCTYQYEWGLKKALMRNQLIFEDVINLIFSLSLVRRSF